MMLKLLVLIFVCASCSLLVKKLDTNITDPEAYKKRIPVLETYCPVERKVKFQLVGGNPAAQTTYKSLMNNPLIKKLDKLDHFAIWSLLQFSIRPDQSSPTSRLQVLVKMENKSHYFDFFSEQIENQYPYLYGIEWVLKKMGRNTKLETYALLIQKHLKGHLKVSKNFEAFLLSKEELLKDSTELKSHFVRGTEVLKENESIPELDYQKLLKHYRQVEPLQKVIVNSSLNTFKVENGNQGSCNYDFNLYNNSIFLIDNNIPDANLFGLIDQDFAFMASSSQRFDTPASILGLPLFKGISRIRSSAVCVIENESGKIWTFSNKSRDPGQHLFQLMRYGLTEAKSIQEVDHLIRHSRYLFLYDPTRLVIESEKSRSTQIENLLKLNIPIYNAEKLGNIWAFASLGSQSRFIIDDRNPGTFLCE